MLILIQAVVCLVWWWLGGESSARSPAIVNGARTTLTIGHIDQDETMVINVFCGVVSGVLSSSLANPTDVVKIRMQAQGSLLQGSMMSNFISIYQTEGTRGLWRGVIPTAQRAAIVVGVELPVYDITKKHLIKSGTMGDTILTHFISSFMCGLAGALASNPVDVVRTRMMNQRVLSGNPMYKGTLDGVMQTWKNEGFFALYKGFWPNWLRLGPWNIILSGWLGSDDPAGEEAGCGGPGLAWLHVCRCEASWTYCQILYNYAGMRLMVDE
ncbi:brain mitochondrial carrier protein 1-like isoform X3 [Oncorhynchus nerka]|uniref:brain mitochondrial carrier protein 1-like isoform X3 n=1 Tax=Oncorhynchus nerka TaxID=8023 RepID=UPI0031B8596D